MRMFGRRNGKRYMLLCERINELELRIAFCKKFGLSYKIEEQELNNLYKKLDGTTTNLKEGGKKNV